MTNGVRTYRNLPSLESASSPGKPPGVVSELPNSVSLPSGPIEYLAIEPFPLPVSGTEPDSVFTTNANFLSLLMTTQQAARALLEAVLLRVRLLPLRL